MSKAPRVLILYFYLLSSDLSSGVLQDVEHHVLVRRCFTRLSCNMLRRGAFIHHVPIYDSVYLKRVDISSYPIHMELLLVPSLFQSSEKVAASTSKFSYQHPRFDLIRLQRNGAWKSFFRIRHPPEILDLMDTVPHDRFFRYLDIFNKEIVVPTDLRAIAEVYQIKADEYMKPSKGKMIIEEVLGNGLIVAEDQDHKVSL